jgi:hypothetical protein
VYGTETGVPVFPATSVVFTVKLNDPVAEVVTGLAKGKF